MSWPVGRGTMRMSLVDSVVAGDSSASWANGCARKGCITKDTPPPFNLPSTTFGYTAFRGFRHDAPPPCSNLFLASGLHADLSWSSCCRADRGLREYLAGLRHFAANARLEL